MRRAHNEIALGKNIKKMFNNSINVYSPFSIDVHIFTERHKP